MTKGGFAMNITNEEYQKLFIKLKESHRRSTFTDRELDILFLLVTDKTEQEVSQ
jgi:hypothetical protein